MTECTDCRQPIPGEPLLLARGPCCKPCFKRWLDESKASYEREFQEERETMPTEPTCGKCGKVMTPENAKLRPELFLHDGCLADYMNAYEPPARHVASADTDIQALVQISAILQALSPDEQRRVLVWLGDRYQPQDQGK